MTTNPPPQRRGPRTTGPVYAPAPTFADASCRSANWQLFFSFQPADIAHAKEICHRCPVMATCLRGAVERREEGGVWGGQLFREGKVHTPTRGRGRPRKHPLPEARATSARSQRVQNRPVDLAKAAG